MLPFFLVLIFFSSAVSARYHEKTRFDRSLDNEFKAVKIKDNHSEKQWSFTDDVTQFVAYKSRNENDCYLENLKQNRNVSHKKRYLKVLYASTALTKLETWRLAGGRIVDFCNGRSVILLQRTRPKSEQILDPFLNEIPIDENDILPRRVTDVLLTPLKSRAKRQIQLEQREKLNKNFNHIRQRRQTNQFRGKFRGQTQSQYLNIGSDDQKEGKAEAEATQQSSRAIVSGSRGMGQAQSMSSGGTGCEDCPGYAGYPNIDGVPDKLRIPGSDSYIPGLSIDSDTSGIMRPGVGVRPSDRVHPGSMPSEQIMHPDKIIPGIPRTYPSGIVPDIIPTEEGRVYPGVVQPGTIISQDVRTYPGGVRSGVISPGSEGTYLGAIQPGTIISKGTETYPGGVPPGIVISRGDATYFGATQPGIATPGGPGTYSGSIQSGMVIPAGDGIHLGGVRPGIITSGSNGIYPGSVHPGTVRSEDAGMYPVGVRPAIVMPGSDGMRPGDIRPGVVTPGRDGMYPGNIQPGVVTLAGGGTSPGSVRPVVVTSGKDGTYPSVVQPGITLTDNYPTGTGITSSVTSNSNVGVGTYPNGILPTTTIPGRTYPGGTSILQTGTGGTYPFGTGIYPSGVQPITIPRTGIGAYPNGVVSGGIVGPGSYTGGAQQNGVTYPGGIVPSTSQDAGVGYPAAVGPHVFGMTGPGTQGITYPGGRTADGQTGYPSSGDIIQPSRISGGANSVSGTQLIYPSGAYSGSGIMYLNRVQPQVSYAEGTRPVIQPGTIYPGQETYLGRDGQVYPGQQYTGTSTGIASGAGIPVRSHVPGEIQYPIGTADGQIGTGRTDQYPSKSYLGTSKIAGTGETSQYYIQGGPGGIPKGPSSADDNAESQASSSVQQVHSGTQASASAQGKYGQGTSQSQVTGTYSGSGTFSAQAGTSDVNKSAQTEISGGKEGVTSNSQGVAGYGKSQAQVQLDSDSGATSTGAQSSGWNHDTNSQVQASSKGGMADAQANGEGSTSSQAQIGFQPYLKNDERVEKHARPFRGSGTASAQSGTHRGQSQSQLQGSFQYGITYTGAAQAGSGSGAASSRKPFKFNVTDTEIFKSFKQDPLKIPVNIGNTPSTSLENTDYEMKQNDRKQTSQNSSTTKQTVVMSSKNNPENTVKRKVLITDKPQTEDALYDEYDDEYTDDDYDFSITTPATAGTKASSDSDSHHKFSRTTQEQSHQSQTIQVAKENRYDIYSKQDSNAPRMGDALQPGQSLSGYTIPPGFRGRIMSTSGTETIAQGDGKSQSQTVSLVPKNSNNTKSPITETRALYTNHERYNNRHMSNGKSKESSIIQEPFDTRIKPASNIAVKPSYYTVTNSVAGKMNGSNPSRKYEHRYYTKSSTCGYFTFSCNVVYGSNGRTKICKPKVPTYPDGTPMRC